MEHEQLLDNIKRILQLEAKYQLKMEDIPSFIDKKMNEHKQLNDEMVGLEQHLDKLYKNIKLPSLN